MRSVLIPVAEIIGAIQLRVVVVHQLEFVVSVVSRLVTAQHGHGPVLPERAPLRTVDTPTPVTQKHRGLALQLPECG